jgi:hypothetical protein
MNALPPASQGWTRPVVRGVFFIPGVVLIMLGIVYMTAAVLLSKTYTLEESLLLLGGALALVTGILVIRRTRLGTALCCLLLVGAAVARVATGSLATTLTGWVNDLLGLLIFFSFAIHLWQQIAYHRAPLDPLAGRDPA